MKAKKRYIVLFVSIAFLIFILLFGRVLPSVHIIQGKSKNQRFSLEISPEVYYRQTLNNCAPYSVMAVINILYKNEIDPEILVRETTWRFYKNLTYPQGLIDLLQKHKIKAKEYSLYLYNEDQRVDWLKCTLDAGSPIILLVEVKHVKHYFTVIGYDENGFMLYDSLQDKSQGNPRETIIDRPEYSGNRYYDNSTLMRLWNDGGYKIFFKNWAVVCTI